MIFHKSKMGNSNTRIERKIYIWYPMSVDIYNTHKVNIYTFDKKLYDLDPCILTQVDHENTTFLFV